VDLNKYCSLFHRRNTKNETWPLWKTLEVLEDWLKKEADDEEGMMTHGAIYRTLQLSMSSTATSTSNNENFSPPAAPVRARFATASTSTPPTRANHEIPIKITGLFLVRVLHLKEGGKRIHPVL